MWYDLCPPTRPPQALRPRLASRSPSRPTPSPQRRWHRRIGRACAFRVPRVILHSPHHSPGMEYAFPLPPTTCTCPLGHRDFCSHCSCSTPLPWHSPLLFGFHSSYCFSPLPPSRQPGTLPTVVPAVEADWTRVVSRGFPLPGFSRPASIRSCRRIPPVHPPARTPRHWATAISKAAFRQPEVAYDLSTENPQEPWTRITPDYGEERPDSCSS